VADEAQIGTDLPKPGGDSAGVFISHVHEDKALADAFTLLIRDITAGSVAAYSSSDNSGDAGIKYGTEWFSWIKEKVQSADHIVALLTPRSVSRPWILFEAGLGIAKPSGLVIGVALGMDMADAFVGPFGVFQNSGSDRASLIKLCKQLISSGRVNPRDQVIESMVDDFVSKVAGHFETTADSSPPAEDPKTAAIFQGLEDLKFLFRERESEFRPSRSRKMAERDLFMLMDSFDESDEKGLSPLRTTIVAGLAESAGMIVEAEILRFFIGKRSVSHRSVMSAERFLMRRRPDSPQEDMLQDLVRREFMSLVERSRPVDEDGPTR
jgi:hypothetical protein